MHNATYRLWGTTAYLLVNGRQPYLDRDTLPYKPTKISRTEAAQYLKMHRRLAPK